MVLMIFSCLFVDFKFVLKCIKYVIDVNTVIESQGLYWNGNEGNAKEGDR